VSTTIKFLHYSCWSSSIYILIYIWFLFYLYYNLFRFLYIIFFLYYLDYFHFYCILCFITMLVLLFQTCSLKFSKTYLWFTIHKVYFGVIANTRWFLGVHILDYFICRETLGYLAAVVGFQILLCTQNPYYFPNVQVFLLHNIVQYSLNLSTIEYCEALLYHLLK